jgi:hypothetical protein
MINGSTVQAVPRDARLPSSSFPDRPIAILVDGSYSMNKVQARLGAQLEWLTQSGAEYALFFCQASCEQTDLNELDDRVYFGNSQLLQQVSQWSKHIKLSEHEREHYASVFVLTDAGSYELSPGTDVVLSPPPQPLWLIHLSE